MYCFTIWVVLWFGLRISMTDKGFILNPAGPPIDFAMPDSYIYVKDVNSEEGTQIVFVHYITQLQLNDIHPSYVFEYLS